MLIARFNTNDSVVAARWSRGLSRAGSMAVRKSWFELGHKLKSDAQDSILNGKKTGRVYLIRRGRTRRRHQASRSGESPANLSGALRRGINFKINGSDSMRFGYSDKTPYGLWLELGTELIAPRPNIEPTAEANHKNARTFFYQSLTREMRRLESESL
jgi:hypothetical protein